MLKVTEVYLIALAYQDFADFIIFLCSLQAQAGFTLYIGAGVKCLQSSLDIMYITKLDYFSLFRNFSTIFFLFLRYKPIGEGKAVLFPPQVSGKNVAAIENSSYLCIVKQRQSLTGRKSKAYSTWAFKIKLTTMEAQLP